LLDRLNPTITELSQGIEQEAETLPAGRLMTHPGVGALTALLSWQADRELSGIGTAGGLEPKSAPAGAFNKKGEFHGALLAGGSGLKRTNPQN
jgi:hypothetical protein